MLGSFCTINLNPLLITEMSNAESVIFFLLSIALDTFGYLLTLHSFCSLCPFSLSWTWCSNQGAELIYQVWWWQGVHCALVGGTCLAWMHCCRLLPCCKVIVIKTRLADADCAFEVQTSFPPPSILQSTFLPNLIIRSYKTVLSHTKY